MGQIQHAFVENLNLECFLKAKSKYNINMKKSWMIGDKETDILAANSAGISKTILLIDNHSKV